MTTETKEIIKRESKRLSSRKFIAWIAITGFYAVALGVWLRTCSMAVWRSYAAIENSRPIVEALGTIKILNDFMLYLTGFYGLMTLIYVGSNLAEKFLGFKFGAGSQS